MNIKLRECTIDDLDRLRDFSEALFYDTFKGMCREEDMQAYLEEAFQKEKIQEELNDKDSEFYFIYYEDVLSGYIKLNEAAAQSDIQDEKSLELERIYILKAIQRKGLGSYLITQVCDMAFKKGKDYIWLGVWEKNVNALAFYKKHGFYKIGMHSFVMGEDVQSDYMLRKDI